MTDGRNYICNQAWATALSLVGGTTYYPTVAGDVGFVLGGITDVSIEALLATTGAGDSITMTFETTNTPVGIAPTWIPSSAAGYDIVAGAPGATSWVASGATGSNSVEVDFDKINKTRFRVKIVVVKAVNNAALTLFFRGR